ncbi:MAG TPA: RrF2 family transcriptional regulator [Trueperaceae bacterium]|nr:RrF2 family transcriptional regulator [Trueperaceae bacterium]
MWVSTRAQYGMRALVEVALAGDTPVSLKTIAQRQDLSQQYLEQIFSHLRRAGIVESVRGAHGGYRLARPTDQIDSLEVVELLEGSVAPVACLDDNETCLRVGHCSTESLWRQVDLAVRQVLGTTTLADLVAERRAIPEFINEGGHRLPVFTPEVL